MCAHNAHTLTQPTAKSNKNHVKQIKKKDHKDDQIKYTHSVVRYKNSHKWRMGKITRLEKTRVREVVGSIRT